MPLLEVTGLAVDSGGRRVVEGIGFMVARGDRFGIAGEASEDKRLLALAIAGLLPANARRSGSLRLNGRELPRGEGGLARIRGTEVGLIPDVPQDALVPGQPVREQLVQAIRRLRRNTKAVEAATALLAEVGLDEAAADIDPSTLTGAQKQRAAIALALAGEPTLLVAHEPAIALDPIAGRGIIDLILEASRRRGLALVYVSENLRAIATVCGRVMVVENGRIVEAGKVSSVFGHPREAYTRQLTASVKPVIRTLARPPAGAALLEAVEVRKRYGRTEALGGLSFSVGEMEALAVIGPSGSGKSTLARLLVGLERPDGGSFVFDRQPYRRVTKALHRDIALVTEKPGQAFDPSRTLADSLGETLRLVPALVSSERKERFAEALHAVGLAPDLVGRRPGEFTAAQLQRFAIARALVTRPRLVVLDEPVKSLEVTARGEILALLARLRADLGLTYLVLGDDPDTAGVIADRVLVLDGGRIVESGTPGALLHRPQHPVTQALIAARLPQLGASLAAAG